MPKTGAMVVRYNGKELEVDPNNTVVVEPPKDMDRVGYPIPGVVGGKEQEVEK